MKTILVWLLISVSDGSYNRGNVTVVERFATLKDCEHVRAATPKAEMQQEMRCVQANIVVLK